MGQPTYKRLQPSSIFNYILCLLLLTSFLFTEFPLSSAEAAPTNQQSQKSTKKVNKTPKKSVKKKKQAGPTTTAEKPKTGSAKKVASTKRAAKAAVASKSKKAKVTSKTQKNVRTSQSKKRRVIQATGQYKGAIVYDINSGKVLFARDENKKIPPASLTKVISMYVALDKIKEKKISIDTLVKVSPKAAAMGGSRMGLKANELVPLSKLFMGMAISSGNDASVAVAEFIAGSEAEFVKLINKKAKSLGMVNTTFENASGLPAKNQFTTPSDMLILAQAYLRAYPDQLQRFHNQLHLEHRGKISRNTNPLIGRYPGADGLKTGYVNASGFNLIATAKRGTRRVITVIMGCPSVQVRTVEVTKLLDLAFASQDQKV